MGFEIDEEKKQLIIDFVECDMGSYECETCSNNENCYMEAIASCNHEFAKSIDYGGYDSEEEFWENL